MDYLKEDFTALDERFDVVFDAVGKSTFGACRKIMTPTGAYVSTELGPYAQNPFLAMLKSRSRGQRVYFPIPVNRQADAEYIRDLMAEGVFKPVIDRHYPLDEVAYAFRYVETGMKTGNVVIDIG